MLIFGNLVHNFYRVGSNLHGDLFLSILYKMFLIHTSAIYFTLNKQVQYTKNYILYNIIIPLATPDLFP